MSDNEELVSQITEDETTDVEETPTLEKPKRPYKMTDARKKTEQKEMKKLENQRRKAMATLGISEDEYYTFNKSTSKTTRPQAELTDSESEEEVVVRRKKVKPKPKKKKIVYVDETESEEEPEPKSVERVRRKTYTDREIRQVLQEPEPVPFRLKRV